MRSLATAKQSNQRVAITLDVDWAPDFMIDFAADALRTACVRATWFVTHASPAINRLREHDDLFELGIHPNLLPGSSHGESVHAVFDHCLRLVPEATSMRTHSLFQSSGLLEVVRRETPLQADASIFLPHATRAEAVVHPCRAGSFVRVPHIWEDDLEARTRWPIWHIHDLLALGDGLKVLDFHPIHVFLNSFTLDAYEGLKGRVPQLRDLSRREAEAVKREGVGTRTFFLEVVKHLSDRGGGDLIQDIAVRTRGGT